MSQNSPKRAPTLASLRELLLKVAINDSDLRMLCLDHLPEMMRHFSAAMSYEAMVNALLERVPPETLLLAISRCPGLASRFVQYQPRVEFESTSAPAAMSATQEIVLPVSLRPARSAYAKAWYVERPDEESQALNALEYSGAAVALNAPGGFGKTWLLQHLTNHLYARGAVVNLDLRAFGSNEIMTNYSGFLRELARQLLVEAGIASDELATAVVDEAWRYSQNPIHNINTLMKRQILGRFTDGRWLILSLDGVDALHAHPYLEDFFTLLRSWMDHAGRPPWSALRLMLTLATAPRLLITCIHRSPFNVATQIYLADLERWQIEQLAAQYGLRWQPEELARLMDVVGGHPYLLRLAMHEARRTGRSVTELVAPTSRIFDDYLEHQERWLHGAPALREAFRRALSSEHAVIDFDSFDRLRHAGLLIKAEGGELKPRYSLYRRLVSSGA